MNKYSGKKYKFHIGNICSRDALGSLLASLRSLLFDVGDDCHAEEFEKCIKNAFVEAQQKNHHYTIDDILCKLEILVYHLDKFHICLVDKRQDVSVDVQYFKNKKSINASTIYILLTKEGFKPLFIVNKENVKQKYKIMVHDEVKHLLKIFIRDTLKYKYPVDLEFELGIEADDISSTVLTDDEISKLIYEKDNLQVLSKEQENDVEPPTNSSHSIPSIDISKRINNISTSKFVIERDEKASSEKQTSNHRPIEEKMLTEVMKQIRQSGQHPFTSMFKNIPNDAYECCTYNPPGDRSCFYWCIKYLVNYMAGASVADLRSMTAYFIENDPDLHLNAPHSHRDNPNISISDYCASVRGDMYAGDPECTAMMNLCGQEIFVFVVDTENKTYWEKLYNCNNINTNERIYVILLDEEEHFQALYMHKKSNPNDQIKVFSCNDETAKNLFRKYIETTGGVKLNANGRPSSKKRRNSDRSSSQPGPVAKRLRISVDHLKIKSTDQPSDMNFCQQAKVHLLVLKITFKTDFTKLIPCSLSIRVVSDDLVNHTSYKFQTQATDNKMVFRDEVRGRFSTDKREIKLILTDINKTNHPPIKQFTQILDFYEDTHGLLTTLELGQYPAFANAPWIYSLSFKVSVTSECSGAIAAIDCIDKICIASHYINDLSSHKMQG